MRLALVVDALGVGGAEQIVVGSVRSLVARGHSVTVVHLDRNDEPPLAAEVQAAGGVVLALPSRARLPLTDHRRIAALARILTDGAFEVVHTHLAHANVAGVLAGRRAGVPTVVSLHSVGADAWRAGFLRWSVETTALRLADRVLAVGPTVAATNQRRLGRRQLDVLANPVPIPPPVPDHERRRIRAALAGDPRRPLVINVGRLTPAKGLEDLLIAFPAVLEVHPGALLLVVGQGPLGSELRALAQRLGVATSTRFLGQRDDVPLLLNAADAFASASHWEGLPLAVLEAMAVGLPTVGTTVGDVPLALGEGRGLLVPPRCPKALAEGIVRLLSDPAESARRAAAARCHVMEHHSVERWTERLEQVYELVRATRARPFRAFRRIQGAG